MPLPSGTLTKFVLYGAISPADVWNVSLWLSSTATPTQSQLDTITSNVATGFNNVVWSASTGALKAQNAAATNYQGCKSYVYMGGVNTLQSGSTISPVAGTGAQILPAYCAIVATLNTASFGRSYRGRIYLPYTGAGMNSNLQYNIAQVQCDNLATFIGGIGDVADPYQGQVSVVSKTRGIATPVTQVILNSLPDTQHGRQSKALPATVLKHAVV